MCSWLVLFCYKKQYFAEIFAYIRKKQYLCTAFRKKVNNKCGKVVRLNHYRLT